MAIGRLLRLSPARTGLLLALLASAAFLWLDGRDEEESGLRRFLVSLDNRVMDAMFRWRGLVAPKNRVAIIDIDEKSLDALGQWPWPRNRLASLVEAAGAAGVKVLGFDIVFAEPDRTSPKALQSALKPLLRPDVSEAELEALDHDRILKAAVDALPAAVLGYVLSEKDEHLPLDPADQPYLDSLYGLAINEGGLGTASLKFGYSATINLKLFTEFVPEGFFTTYPDPSGTVRRVPLLMEYGGKPYPALATEMLRLGLHDAARQEGLAHPIWIEVDPLAPVLRVPPRYDDNGRRIDAIYAPRWKTRGVRILRTFVPTNEHCELLVNYRGDTHTFPYISAIDLLEGRAEAKAELKDAYAILGTSAVGLMDLRATPFTGIYPGVEVHANAIDNVLSGDFLREEWRVRYLYTLGLILGGGLVLAFALVRVGPKAGLAVFLALLGLATAGNYRILFLGGFWVGPVYPVLALGVVFAGIALHGYLTEGRQRRFIREAFGTYLSPAVVQQLERDPSRARSLEGEQREMTVLFSDIRDFTTISEKLGARELSALLNEYLTPMADHVLATGGTVDKFIGDAVMAFWGAPLTEERHAEQAARTALAMQRSLETLRPAWVARGYPEVRIGIGLNSGTMSVGNMGSRQRLAYTVMGDNVNLASRLESLTKNYGVGILVGDGTRKALGAHFHLRTVDCVRVKGKREPVLIHELLGEGAVAERQRAETEAFERAFAAYHAQRWDEAEALLRALADAGPHPLFALYLERVAKFRLQPPGAGWDGVYTFTTK